MGCGSPDCTGDHSVLFPYQFCHPHEGLGAKYEKATGTLILFCSVCERVVTVFLVAETNTPISNKLGEIR
jgi:hypothetical protein